MRKYSSRIFIILAFFMVIAPTISANAENSPETSEEYIREMVEPRDGGNLNNQAVEKVIDTLTQIDQVLIELVYEEDVDILITDLPASEVTELATTADREDGRAIDDFDGYYVPGDKFIYIEENDDVNSALIAVHEFGHAVDHALGDEYIVYNSYNNEIRELINREKQSILPMDFPVIGDSEDMVFQENLPTGTGYYDQEEEFFAEVFAYYYLGGEYTEHLRINGPETYEYISKISHRFLTLNEFTSGEIKVSWEPHESVSEYEIYMDSQPIETVSGEEAEYVIEPEIETTFVPDHRFRVVAYDEDGNEFLTTNEVDTREAPLDTSNLEAIVEEAELLREQVDNDHTRLLEYPLEQAYKQLEAVNIDGVEATEEITQSRILGTELLMLDSLSDFKEIETIASVDDHQAVSEEGVENTEEEGSTLFGLLVNYTNPTVLLITLSVLVLIGIVSIVIIFIILVIRQRSKNK